MHAALLHDTYTTHANTKPHVHTCTQKLQYSNTISAYFIYKLWPNTV